MIKRLRLSSAALVLLTSVFISAVLPQSALASSRPAIDCDAELLAVPRADTLKALRERNTEKMNRYIAQHPMPGFTNMEAEVLKEQIGEIAPRALQQILGPEFKSVSSPAPSVSMDTAVNMHEEGDSFPVHLDIPWAGRRTSTTVYASLPKTLVPRGHQYLVGPEYPAVVFHMHGGGTPTATGKNAMSIGQHLAKKGIPVIAPDLAGHGRATRKMQGLMTAEEQVNWILEIIKKTVHPNVKVILSGHSWGGEFAEYMWRHSDEEKYKQISVIFPLSAPVDVSLGGDEKLKFEWDEWYERNYKTLEKDISEADFEFQENSHYHGKVSETGSYFTYGTHMDYQTPPVSVERQKQLKPKVGFVGFKDGLVRVGAEKQYDAANGGLVGRSRYTVLTMHRTWKSEKEGGKLYDTGHNIWDALDENGRYIVYGSLEDETFVEAPQGMGADDADAAAVLLNNMKRQWDNNFVFRQMVASHIEYVATATPERTKMGMRKQVVETYLNAVRDQEKIIDGQIESKIKEELKPLREKHGLHPGMTVERAGKEVLLPELTPARREALNTFLNVAGKVADDLQAKNAPDPEWDADIATIKEKFAAGLANVGTDLENYKEAFDKYNKLKGKLDKADEKKKSDLTKIHQAYRTAADARARRFAEEKERLIGLLHKPDGVEDVKSAQYELSKDRKPKAVVKQFLEEASAKETTIRQAAAKDLERMLASIPRPPGVESVEAARAESKEIVERDTYTFAPSDNQVLADAATRVRAAIANRNSILKGTAAEVGLEALIKEADQVLPERAKLSKIWETAWKKKDPNTKKELLTSAELQKHLSKVNDLLESYKGLYLEHEHVKGVWMRELRKQGRLTEANLLAPPPEMTNLRHRYQAVKAVFETERDRIPGLRWSEALAGKLKGPEKLVESATQAAIQLWGKSAETPTEGSVVAKARALEERLETARSRESVARQELERAQWLYAEEMRAAGEAAPFVVSRVVIREELDLDYDVLVNRLRDDPSVMTAFRNLMEKWKSHLSILRVEASSKDTGNY